MPFNIDSRGWITGSPDIRTMPRPEIEHGPLRSIKGIIVHQTDSESAEATLNAYNRQNANGAHFLIAKDGTVYQVASLLKKTWHVGKLKSKCYARHECSAAELKLYSHAVTSTINSVEMQKIVPLRYPSNEDSIGIELVGLCRLDQKYLRPSMTPKEINDLKAELGVFDAVTPQQNNSLNFLIRHLQESLRIPQAEVYSHPEVSWKNPTEAKTAQWAGR